MLVSARCTPVPVTADRSADAVDADTRTNLDPAVEKNRGGAEASSDSGGGPPSYQSKLTLIS